jgi:hypothetical protein
MISRRRTTSIHRARAKPLAAIALALLPALTVLLAACGGGRSSSANAVSFPTVLSLGGCDVCPTIANTALAVGPNRVLIGLTDAGGAPILDANVHARFYDLNSGKPVFSSEAFATLVTVQNFYINEDEGDQKTVTGNTGVYVVEQNFPKAGNWGVQLDVTRAGKQLKPIPYTFTVLDKTPEPQVGDPAPPSQQITLSNVGGDDSKIDTSSPLRTAMHEITIADALKLGKPIVVAFATPAFCTSRLCGPMMESVMDPLAQQYGGQATFIHIEPYQLDALRDTGQQIAVPAMIDRQGKIAGKFEGIASASEVGKVLQAAIGSG